MSMFLLPIPAGLSAWLGALAYLLLVFTPGAWITFGLALESLPFWARLFTAAMLSPLIVCAEFYAVRLIGVPFGPTAAVLVILNLPAIYLAWKRRPRVGIPDRSHWLVAAAVFAVPVVCLIAPLTHLDARIFSPHGWYHADVTYMFARGYLVPEDPTLAGFKMSYPVWSALVFEAVHSFLVNSPPLSCYIWSNLVSLIVVCGFAAGVTKEMGGGKLAQFTSGIWLLVGVNPVGYILTKVAPIGARHGLWGDFRYAQWVEKFLVSSPMALALGMMMAIIYLLVRSDPLTKPSLVVLCLLLSGIGLLYPLLLPPACGIIGARGLAALVGKQDQRPTLPYKEWLALAGVLLVAVLATYIEVRFLTSGRQLTTKVVLLSVFHDARRKAIESLVATSVLLAGLAFTLRSCWKSRRAATALLLSGALASYILYVAVFLPFYENEYKFVFAVAMCLAVFPALAVERIWREWPRAKAVPVLAAVALLLLIPYGHQAYVDWPAPWVKRPNPKFERAPLLDAREFYLHLDQREKWSGVCNAVLRMTPANTVLVLNDATLYYPQLTARSLYVSAANRLYDGVNLYADELDGDLRGYGRQILEQRRATMADVFDAQDAGRRDQAFDTILTLNRPVAIIAEPRHSDLLGWLKQRKMATQLYEENGLSLWLIDESNAMRN